MTSVTGGSEEVEKMKQMKIVLDSIAHECGPKKGIMKLGRKEKVKAAARSNVTTEAINDAISSFERMKQMHGWLKERKDRGARLPVSQAEAQSMMKQDMMNGSGEAEQKKFLASMKKKAQRRA